MTLDELIGRLKEISAAGHGDSEVRLACQPEYPFEYSIDGFKLTETHLEDIEEAENILLNNVYPEDREEIETALKHYKEKNESILYIREGTQLGYVSRGIWDD